MATKPPEKKTGSYVELSVDHIDDGEFRQRFDAELRRAYRELERYEQASGDLKGKVKLTCTVEINRESESHFSIGDSFTLKVPKVAKTSMARGGKGRLLVNPEGDSLNDSDQMTLMTFDRFGNQLASIDPATGEVVDADDDADPSVAGKLPAG